MFHFRCRGGLVFWADLVGAKHIVKRLTEWSKAYGDFFTPCRYLVERANAGVKLVCESQCQVWLLAWIW